MGTLLVPFSVSSQNGKRHWIGLTAILLIMGCSNVEFEKGVSPAGAGPTASTPCSPIGGSFPSNENGMYGNIIVQQPETCTNSGLQSCNSHQEMTSGAQGSNLSDIVVSAPLVATRPFDRGFETRSGGLLTYPSGFGAFTGQSIVEFWGLNMRTKIALTDGDYEGDYQLAAIVDDGFRITREDTGEVILDLQGVNSSTLVTRPGAGQPIGVVRFARGQRIPFKIQYYQTPRTEIAFLMLWRPVSGSAYADPEEFQSYGGNYYFNWQSYTPSTGSPPTANFQNLLNRGWKVMKSQNFWMPDSLTHSCI